MIVVEECDELLKVEAITCGGERTRVDVTKKGK
jgi:hypothetical protein